MGTEFFIATGAFSVELSACQVSMFCTANWPRQLYLYMLQVKSNLRSIFSNLGQFVSTLVNLMFLFLRQTKNIFGTFNLLFISTLLTSPTIPSLLFQHPSPYSFYLNAYLVSLELQTFGFPLDPHLGDLDASSTVFFLITYTLQQYYDQIFTP